MRKKGEYYAVTNIKVIQPLLNYRVTAMATHWVFQNMIGMGITELAFKLGIDIVLAVAFLFLFSIWIPLHWAIIIGLVVAHTINFLFNAQIFVVLKHFGDIIHPISEYEAYIQGIQKRLSDQNSIRWAAIYGSMARGELKTTSDLDVRFIRYPGFMNGVRSCWFTLRERTRAHLSRFPVDFMLFDNPHPLKRLREDESPIVIFNEDQKAIDLINI